ncbi:hypothetical protein C5167_008425 [Papaver somniferum]|uniref:Uncharacterized protein n=1 Tax=Papaver somniferum TaxID=3469 RepID=A0A4Y7JUH7_PAPSO|nr:hypothetical protein C5167_008425 [Papaver somniferum]
MKRNLFRIFSKSKKVIKQCGLELYQNCLTIHPVKTQIISSGILSGIGDIAAQRITHSRRIKVEVEPHQKTHDDDDEDEKFKGNCKRAAITSGFGFGFVGPIGHYWYVRCSSPISHTEFNKFYSACSNLGDGWT